MAIIQTSLNYTRAILTNISNSFSILVGPTPVLLLEWGHFVPLGTRFVEVNA